LNKKEKKLKKILLIFPPTKAAKQSHRPCVPPSGILYIAAVLREADYEVKVLDAIVEDYMRLEPAGPDHVFYGLSFEEIEKRIKEIRPDVVGVSCIFSASFTAVKRICRIVKAFDADIVTMTGGAHPSFLPEKCLLEVPELDYIVIGEGEHTARELLDRLNLDKDISDIDGLAYRKEGGIRVNAKTKFIDDLDGLPLPARDLVPIKKYIGINAPHGITSKEKINMSVTTSRGCPFKCVFCSSNRFWGRKYRMRSAGAVLDEIETLVRDYGAKEIQFLDDNLTLDRKRALEIFKGIIDRKLDIVWNTPNGVAVWTLDEEMLRLMKASGCYALTLAIESGDQDVLTNVIKKPLQLEQVKRVVRLIKEIGIQTHAFFVIGFPDEKPEQIRRTFAFAKEMDLDSASFTIAQPLPGSELDAMVKNCLKEGFEYENIAYLLSSYDTKYFKGRELEKMVAREFLKYNLNFYKHPIRFAVKFGNYILKNPLYSLRFVFGLLKKV